MKKQRNSHLSQFRRSGSIFNRFVRYSICMIALPTLMLMLLVIFYYRYENMNIEKARAQEYLSEMHEGISRNMEQINLYGLIFGFPFPIIFALLLNEVRSNAFRRVTQTITYMPHFVSVVIICGLTKYFLKSDGLITGLLVKMFDLPKTNMLAVSAYFRTIYTAMNIWQGFGWGSIIYFAALTNVDPALIEAAAIDGANRYQRIVHVSLPAILPTIVTTLILRLGNIMSAGYEKIILLYSPGVYETADIISSYVYRRGLQNFDYSYAAAIDLFNSAVNIVFILLANSVSKSINKTSIW